MLFIRTKHNVQVFWLDNYTNNTQLLRPDTVGADLCCLISMSIAYYLCQLCLGILDLPVERRGHSLMLLGSTHALTLFYLLYFCLLQHTYICINTHTHTNPHTHACTHTHTHSCIHTHAHTLKHTHTHAHVYAWIHTHMHTSTCACTHTHCCLFSYSSFAFWCLFCDTKFRNQTDFAHLTTVAPPLHYVNCLLTHPRQMFVWPRRWKIL